MRPIATVALALAALVASPAGQAQPRPPGTGGGVVVAPGGRWAGGGYHHPWYGPAYGYGRWGYGYPGYGYGYGIGFGYGAGWALAASSPWYWGSPAVVYAAPAFYPYAYVAPPYPSFQVQQDLTYVQQAPQQADSSAAQPPAATQAGTPATFWYYCTEPAGYHPYVSQCSRPWIAVNPQSLPPSGAAPAP